MMTQEIRLPELGENIESAEVARVLVAVGDAVLVDQALVEVETDKASMEIPSPVAGQVVGLEVAAGDVVRVGQVLARIADGAVADDGVGALDTRAAAEPEEEEKGGKEEGRAGTRVEPERAGTGPGDPAGEAPDADRTDVSVHGQAATLAEPVPASPSVRRLAREIGVDLRRVLGSGPGGRISAEDVKAHVKGIMESAAGAALTVGSAAAGPALPDLAEFGEVERQPIAKVRRLTAESMSRSWAAIPHVTQHDRADVTDLEAFRNRHGKRVEAAGGKLTVTAIVLKLAALGLRRFPRLNSSLDAAADEVVIRHYVHIGVAVDTERGLLVPVVRDADRKSIADLARELTDLAARARSKQLLPDEMRGAGFTVSNLGGLGTTDFSPIVTWPQAAVLGVGRARTEAVWTDGTFVPRSLLPLSLSYDHRLIDGAEAARFLRWLSEALEQPLLALLDGAP